jgi:hypothetical protein
MRLEKSNIPANLKSKYNTRFRNFEHDLDSSKRKLESYTNDRSKLFGDRYTDNPDSDAQLEQRQQLLSGTDRLQRSSGRLTAAQRMALETEQIGAGTLSDLHRQREQITNTRTTLLESESYTDRSIKTLKGMARRCVFSGDLRRNRSLMRQSLDHGFHFDIRYANDITITGRLRTGLSLLRSSRCLFCLSLRSSTASSDERLYTMERVRFYFFGAFSNNTVQDNFPRFLILSFWSRFTMEEWKH